MSKGVVFNGNTGPITVQNSEGSARYSILGRLVEIIARGSTESTDMRRVPADVEVKIDYNNLNECRWVVHSFIGDSLLIEESMQELNQTIVNGSTKLKRQMKQFYFKALGKYSISTAPIDIDKLKKHSDEVVKEVLRLATDFIEKSSDVKAGFYKEDIENGVALIASYSIIECVVLEVPSDNN